MTRVTSRLGIVILALFGAMGTPALSQFAVCNQTFDVVNVAIGKYDRNVFATEGWWTIGPNQCANVIDDELRVRFVYVFAQDVFGKTVLSGATRMCVGTDKFEIRGETDCIARGYIEAPFHEVDTQRTERWTLFLSPAPN